MGKRILALILTISTFCTYAQTRPGSLRGTVSDTKTGETIPFANIVIKDNGGAVIQGGATDIDGRYNINPVNPGTYNVEASFAGYAKVTIEGLLISPNTPTIQDFKLREATEMLGDVTVTYSAPLIDKTKSSKVTTAEDITNMAVRDITSVASQAAGVSSGPSGTSIRGARPEGTVYFIDGVKVRGSVNIPQSAIAQTEVITGGLPAQYGDAVGGVISTTTKGPSSEYFGTAEILTSLPFKYVPTIGSDLKLDGQNYNLGAFTIGGPILKKDDGSALLGFLFSSEFEYVEEPRPGVIPYAKVNEDLLNDIQQNPILLDSSRTSYINRTELVTEDDLTDIQTRPNSYDREMRLNGNLSLKTSRTTNLTLGGRWTYNNSKRETFGNSLFNYDNNLDQINSDWSSYLRFQQQFENDPEANSLIKNAFYSLQVDYTRTDQKIYDKDHGDNFFDYGYVGKFDIQNARNYQYGLDTATGVFGYRFVGLNDTAVNFTPGTANPVLSNYMQRYYELAESNPGLVTSDFSTLLSAGTPPVNGQNPLSVYSGLWSNAGSVQAFSALGINSRVNYFKQRNSQFRVTASSNFDIKDHSLIVGFEYEQRVDRGYALDATQLWSQMRLLQNRPNNDLDLNNPILVTNDGVFTDTIEYNYAYVQKQSSAFAENIRRALDMDPLSTEQINIDNLDPSIFSLDMFSPDEVINPNGNRGVNYYGYDYTGQLTTRNSSISDFFTETDDNGRYTRPVAPFEPIYIAGYVQDQFTFNDLFFNVGVRVDRFDLNQSVLRDPYILYPFYTVGDIPNSKVPRIADPDLGKDPIPANIGQDYRVYVNGYPYSENTTIVGYRNGDDWFNAQGEPLPDPSKLAEAAGGNIAPFTVQTPEQRSGEGGLGSSVIPAESFVDYQPQTVVMPRIAFNFPITDEAIFIAHYDLLAQRPSTGIARLDPFDYLDLANNRNGGTVNNPNLRPQKTTEYELGFKQVLTEKSALKISAFYRELRDLLQTVSFTQAYPITYVAYGNRDFGTVKGFSLEYEMRRTNNLKLDANYTLQFADGTGSSTTTGLNLARSGQPNLRTILPLSFDSRHQILVRLDYRYGKGPRYDGPVWWNSRVLERFGVNVTMSGSSGEPYTKRDAPYVVTNTNPSSVSLVEGQINGARLPWQVTFDARINKIFDADKLGKRTIEVYVQILNLLNTQNVRGVYAYTGSPTDDGYLASPSAQSSLQEQTSSRAYVDLYNRNIVNGFNYNLPRRVRLGIAYNF